MAELTVIARYTGLDEAAADVAEVLRRHAQQSEAEPGCLEFAVYRSIQDPAQFLLYERYADEDAFESHRRSDHFRDNITNYVAPRLVRRSWSRYEAVGAQ